MIRVASPAVVADILAVIYTVALMAFFAGCTHLQTVSTVRQPQTVPADEFTRPLGKLEHPSIVVEKSARVLTVFDGERIAKKYHVCSGSVSGDKEREGDRKTPIGEFFVCYKNPNSKYTLSMGLNYPRQKDADRGLFARPPLITQDQHDAIVTANRPPRCFDGPTWEALWKTPLGGEIMIHGGGAAREGTAGCVGMDDDDIRELYPAIAFGTPVTIKP